MRGPPWAPPSGAPAADLQDIMGDILAKPRCASLLQAQAANFHAMKSQIGQAAWFAAARAQPGRMGKLNAAR